MTAKSDAPAQPVITRRPPTCTVALSHDGSIGETTYCDRPAVAKLGIGDHLCLAHLSGAALAFEALTRGIPTLEACE